MAQSLNGAYDLQTVSVKEAVEAALESLSQTIFDEAAIVEVAIEDFAIEADRSQAGLLIQNIVSNAVKYHKPGAKPVVKISTSVEDGVARRLIVADKGIGFPAGSRDDIFEPFKRLHTRDQYPGSGIGLAICKAIVSRHGWRISATSTPQGACFEVVFAVTPDDVLEPKINIGGALDIAKPSNSSDWGG